MSTDSGHSFINSLSWRCARVRQAGPREERRGSSPRHEQPPRNPSAASALGAATMAPNLAATIFAAQVQDHERSAGPWHAEWPTLPSLLLVTSGALAAIVDMAEGLEIELVETA